MFTRLAIASALVLSASGAIAADLRETHVPIQIAPSKGLAPAYRPIATKDCMIGLAHVAPAGKIVMAKIDRDHCAKKDRAAG